jgi:ABC-type branched-subunit amino acid transport system ATPase component
LPENGKGSAPPDLIRIGTIGGLQMENAVVLKGMKKYFPGTKALDWDENDTSEFRAGEIHGLVGENGAGKSTLFRFSRAFTTKPPER